MDVSFVCIGRGIYTNDHGTIGFVFDAADAERLISINHGVRGAALTKKGCVCCLGLGLVGLGKHGVEGLPIDTVLKEKVDGVNDFLKELSEFAWFEESAAGTPFLLVVAKVEVLAVDIGELGCVVNVPGFYAGSGELGALEMRANGLDFGEVGR